MANTSIGWLLIALIAGFVGFQLIRVYVAAKNLNSSSSFDHQLIIQQAIMEVNLKKKAEAEAAAGNPTAAPTQQPLSPTSQVA